MKRLVLYLLFLLVSLQTFSEEIYFVRANSNDGIHLIPLSSISSITVIVSDSVNFNYSINVEGVSLVDNKIYANLPLYERVNGEVEEVEYGFNIEFKGEDWLIRFLKSAGLEWKNVSEVGSTYSRNENVAILTN